MKDDFEKSIVRVALAVKSRDIDVWILNRFPFSISAVYLMHYD